MMRWYGFALAKPYLFLYGERWMSYTVWCEKEKQEVGK